ncbi:RHS repeat-associated core domain-containing protein [Flavobacterium sp. GSA192]|uniref:RHS repeat-associated core domain-containing protein n=1 Tax=Flavobacterium sp. GSA192 TaxID=2576304 RepID=UPI0015E3B0DA|nr:RHS repeat-associated core domain-containing protein [Flavobacterium sp. GSA192]
MAVYNKPVSSGVITQADLPIYGSSRLGVYNRQDSSSNYEITDHLGNVRAVIKKVNGNPIMQAYADYYPFGEQLPGRNSLSNYRYAFQGQELDGETNMEAFQLRLWDGRIGRWLSPDPYGEFHSPYLGMGNNPISMIDPDGGSTECEGCPGKGTAADPYRLPAVVIQGKPKSSNYFSFSNIQTSLDVLGSTEIPVVSQLADISSAGMSAYQGDYTGAMLSLGGAIIPGMSQAKLGLKLAKRTEKLVDIYQGTKKAGKYFGQSVDLTSRYTKSGIKKEFVKAPEVIIQVPARIASAVEQQLISIHGTVKYGNGMGANKRLQMSLKNQIENKELMKEAMDYLDNNVPNWMTKF